MSLLPSGLPASSPRLQIGYQQPAQQQQQQQRPPPKCAEVCLDLLTAEAVRFFSDKQYGPAAGAALQAVGFRVGRQLAERYARCCSWHIIVALIEGVGLVYIQSCRLLLFYCLCCCYAKRDPYSCLCCLLPEVIQPAHTAAVLHTTNTCCC